MRRNCHTRAAALTSYLAYAVVLALPLAAGAQTREQGPWWPSPHGADDQAGASNYVTAAKILQALQIPRTGQTYELGHPYAADMPAYGNRPYYLNVTPAAPPSSAGGGVVHQDYFTGFIGQMGTQFDAWRTWGATCAWRTVRSKRCSTTGLPSANSPPPTAVRAGCSGWALSHMRPFITRGILIDIAAYRGVATLAPDDEVMVADVLGALQRQGMSEATLEPGDAVLFHYGWSVHWTNPRDTTIRSSAPGTTKAPRASAGRWPAGWSPGARRWWAATRAVCRSCRRAPRATCITRCFSNRAFAAGEHGARRARRDEVYTFLFLNLTLRIVGATGSPVRPIAVR